MPHAAATTALASLLAGSLVTHLPGGWQVAFAAAPPPLPASSGLQAQRSRPSPAPSSLEGDSLVINGRSQQARWRWIGRTSWA